MGLKEVGCRWRWSCCESWVLCVLTSVRTSVPVFFAAATQVGPRFPDPCLGARMPWLRTRGVAASEQSRRRCNCAHALLIVLACKADSTGLERRLVRSTIGARSRDEARAVGNFGPVPACRSRCVRPWLGVGLRPASNAWGPRGCHQRPWLQQTLVLRSMGATCRLDGQRPDVTEIDTHPGVTAVDHPEGFLASSSAA